MIECCSIGTSPSGSSQTEGMNDLDAHGGIRGWADRFAVYLAECNPDLLYANLAIRGRRTKRIRADQLEPALGLNPTWSSVMAGVNDVLGSFDLDETMSDLEDMYVALRGIGATVIGCTFPDPGASFSIARRLTPRVRALNAAIRDAAARHDVVLVDFEAYPAVNDPRWWSHDRLPLNTAGHARLAAAFADVLGVHPDILAGVVAAAVGARLVAKPRRGWRVAGPFLGAVVRASRPRSLDRRQPPAQTPCPRTRDTDRRSVVAVRTVVPVGQASRRGSGRTSRQECCGR